MTSLLEAPPTTDYPGPVTDTTQAPEIPYLWSQDLENQFDNYWQIVGADRTAEERAEALDIEKRFFNNVLVAALDVAHQPGNKKVTLLFDVDDTIGEAANLVRASVDPIARPAFSAVIALLDNLLKDRLEIGLLTTRTQASLNDQLEHPTYLANIPRLNANYFFSTRDLIREDPVIADLNRITDLAEIPNADLAKVLASVEKIVNPEIIEETKRHPRQLNFWFDIKLAVLQSLVTQNPDRAFVFIDDLACTKYIKPNHQDVRGVQAEIFKEKIDAPV